MIKTVSAKLQRMRKPQDFVVYPKSRTDNGDLVVQSDKSIGRFDPETGKGVLNVRGPFFAHLSQASPFTFPMDFVEACIEAQPKSGDTIGASSITGVVKIA